MNNMFDLNTLIETYGTLGVSLIVFAESGLFFGFFLPGDSLLFTAGFLASQGYFNVWVLLVFITIAAVIGDGVGYYIGNKFGHKVFNRPRSFFFDPKHVETTKKFFQAHGNKAVLMARFLPGIRTFIPVFAGIGTMPYRTFLAYNIIGATAWTFSVTLAGYYLGRIVPESSKYIEYIVLAIIAVSLSPAFIAFIRVKQNRIWLKKLFRLQK